MRLYTLPPYKACIFFGEQKEVQIQPKFSRMLYINTAKFSFLVNIHDIYLMHALFLLVKTNGMALWANISTFKWSKQLVRATFTSRAGANWLKVLGRKNSSKASIIWVDLAQQDINKARANISQFPQCWLTSTLAWNVIASISFCVSFIKLYKQENKLKYLTLQVSNNYLPARDWLPIPNITCLALQIISTPRTLFASSKPDTRIKVFPFPLYFFSLLFTGKKHQYLMVCLVL